MMLIPLLKLQAIKESKIGHFFTSDVDGNRRDMFAWAYRPFILNIDEISFDSLHFQHI